MLKLIDNPNTTPHETSNHFSEVKKFFEILLRTEIFAYRGKSDAKIVIRIEEKEDESK